MPEPLDPIARIRATRVDLVVLSRAAIACLLNGRRDQAASQLLGAAIPAGWPDADDCSLLENGPQDIRRDPVAEPLLLFAIVRREPVPLTVGHAGFHGPPGVNGSATCPGHSSSPTRSRAYRRRGYAREAAAALVDWARSVHGIRRILASIAPGNERSARVVTSIGFVPAGQRWDDEDGILVSQAEHQTLRDGRTTGARVGALSDCCFGLAKEASRIAVGSGALLRR